MTAVLLGPLYNAYACTVACVILITNLQVATIHKLYVQVVKIIPTHCSVVYMYILNSFIKQANS